jgi:hypothetical protein
MTKEMMCCVSQALEKEAYYVLVCCGTLHEMFS